MGQVETGGSLLGGGGDELSALRWYVLHTRSHHEKALATVLMAAGVKHYLPLMRKPTFRRHRKVFVEFPLFPSYVFAYGTKEDTFVADRTRHVAHTIDVVDQQRFEWELGNVRQGLEEGADFTSHRCIEEGQIVEVTAGPFKGLQGYVVKGRVGTRVVLQMTSFAQAVSLEVEASLLEPVEWSQPSSTTGWSTPTKRGERTGANLAR